MAVLNSLVKRVLQSVCMCIRSRLTDYAHEKYLSNLTFYRASELDNRLQSPAASIVTDIEKFSVAASRLESSLVKPVIDAIFMSIAVTAKL